MGCGTSVEEVAPQSNIRRSTSRSSRLSQPDVQLHSNRPDSKRHFAFAENENTSDPIESAAMKASRLKYGGWILEQQQALHSTTTDHTSTTLDDSMTNQALTVAGSESPFPCHEGEVASPKVLMDDPATPRHSISGYRPMTHVKNPSLFTVLEISLPNERHNPNDGEPTRSSRGGSTVSPSPSPTRRTVKALPTFAPVSDIKCSVCQADEELLTCEICPQYYICCRCFFDNGAAFHDETHPMQPYEPLVPFRRVIEESEDGGSYVNGYRGGGGGGSLHPNFVPDSSFSSATGGFGNASISSSDSIINVPCRCCFHLIPDGAESFRCNTCAGFIVCKGCVDKMREHHEHGEHTFTHIRKHRPSTISTTALRKRNVSGKKLLNDYVVVKLLGRGSYGKIKLIQHVRTHELFALKSIKRQSFNVFSSPQTVEAQLKEIAIMKLLRHENVVKLLEVIDDPECHKVYLILELMDGVVYKIGDSPLPLELVRQYGGQALKGLLYLHSQVIYHRDVKPENLLLRNGVVKVSDFGVSDAEGGVTVHGTKGTPAFLCPEVVEGKPVSGELVDAWAFGITLYTMAVGRTPFASSSVAGIFQEILTRKISYPPNLDPRLRQVLEALLAPELSNRSSLSQVSKLEFFIDFAVESAFERIVVDEDMAADALVECRRVEKQFRRMSLCPARMKVELDDDCLYYELISAKADPFFSPPSASLTPSKLNTVAAGRSPLRRKSSTVKPQLSAHLTLENMHIDKFNSELFASCKPLALTLTNNQLTIFEIQGDGLLQLEQLSITKNQLHQLSPTISRLTALTRLDLSLNQLSTLPEELSTLGNLKTLNIDNNRFTELPPVIGLLPALKRCNAACNPICSLPAWLQSSKDLCLALDNYPETQQEWMRSMVFHCPTVTILWNSIFPLMISKNLFVGRREHEQDHIIAELRIEKVLRPKNHRHFSPAQPARMDYSDSDVTSIVGFPTPDDGRLRTEDSSRSITPWGELDPSVGTPSSPANLPSFSFNSPNDAYRRASLSEASYTSIRSSMMRAGPPQVPIPRSATPAHQSQVGHVLELLSNLMGALDKRVLVCLTSAAVQAHDPLYEVVLAHLKAVDGLEGDEAEGLVKEALFAPLNISRVDR